MQEWNSKRHVSVATIIHATMVVLSRAVGEEGAPTVILVCLCVATPSLDVRET
jgi:hypothetical protein